MRPVTKRRLPRSVCVFVFLQTELAQKLCPYGIKANCHNAMALGLFAQSFLFFNHEAMAGALSVPGQVGGHVADRFGGVTTFIVSAAVLCEGASLGGRLCGSSRRHTHRPCHHQYHRCRYHHRFLGCCWALAALPMRGASRCALLPPPAALDPPAAPPPMQCSDHFYRRDKCGPRA
jgi:hypothetical protein